MHKLLFNPINQAYWHWLFYSINDKISFASIILLWKLCDRIVSTHLMHIIDQYFFHKNKWILKYLFVFSCKEQTLFKINYEKEKKKRMLKSKLISD